jgi:hypothetical protein
LTLRGQDQHVRRLEIGDVTHWQPKAAQFRSFEPAQPFTNQLVAPSTTRNERHLMAPGCEPASHEGPDSPNSRHNYSLSNHISYAL